MKCMLPSGRRVKVAGFDSYSSLPPLHESGHHERTSFSRIGARSESWAIACSLGGSLTSLTTATMTITMTTASAHAVSTIDLRKIILPIHNKASHLTQCTCLLYTSD